MKGMNTATEVESAWSPAKRFTLVKPTFKGLESQKLTHPSHWFGNSLSNSLAVSDDGNTFVAESHKADDVDHIWYSCSVFEKKTDNNSNLATR